MSTMIVSKAEIIESKQPHTLDLGNVCAPRFNNGGARAETLRMSDNNLPQNLAYKKDVCLQHLDDALTPSNALGSKKSAVCSRSGASRDLLPVSGNKFALANLHKYMKDNYAL